MTVFQTRKWSITGKAIHGSNDSSEWQLSLQAVRVSDSSQSKPVTRTQLN